MKMVQSQSLIFYSTLALLLCVALVQVDGFDVTSSVMSALEPVMGVVRKVKEMLEDVKDKVSTIVSDVKSIKTDTVAKVSELATSAKSMASEMKQLVNITIFIDKIKHAVSKEDVADLEIFVTNFMMDLVQNVAHTVHKRWPIPTYVALATLVTLLILGMIGLLLLCIVSCRLTKLQSHITDAKRTQESSQFTGDVFPRPITVDGING
ncbi:hypothetical protein HvAV-3i_gp052 [Heliothis virescens ascovirus 3i]|nr:hypothetical protein HvAV-3i_gp052 [Heliothis virescens ascovirus 3i]